MWEQNSTRLTRVINIRNNFSFVHFIEELSSDLSNLTQTHIYIFLFEEVIETITVRENRCSYVLFCCIETNTRIHFRKKLFLFCKLICIEMFCLLKP